MNLEAWQRQMDAAVMQQALFTMGLLVLLFVLTWTITYYVFKAAIRDGIRESGLVDRQRPRLHGPDLTTEPAPLPDMRASR